MKQKLKILLSCEHASSRLPPALAPLLHIPPGVLKSHRAYDRGALETAQVLRQELKLPLIAGSVSRLVVDLNRSPNHPHRFSTYSKKLSSHQKVKIHRRYYLPYRQNVEAHCQKQIQRGHTLLHLSIHSFTPTLRGQHRRAHLAWLYDPVRSAEKNLAAHWRKSLRQLQDDWLLRRNYPYLGVADGLIPYLRRRFPKTKYWGLELELNQALFGSPKKSADEVGRLLANSLRRTLIEMGLGA